jgi:GntR family carbon starvation induced transcriptional regulator
MTSLAGTGPGALPATRADWVDHRLRAAILSGELAPGQKLVAGPLAARLAVSATPLREAIQRLAATGLVEIAPQRGARVAAASPRDAEEIYELRTLLEPLALRDSLAHGDAEHRAAIEAAFARMLASDRDGTDVVETLDRHAAFHATLLARCRSRWLRRITALLADHSQRYAFLAVGADDPRGHHDAVTEHRALRDAALVGRAAQAADLLRAHLQRTLHAMRALAKATPQPEGSADDASHTSRSAALGDRAAPLDASRSSVRRARAARPPRRARR